MKLNLLKNEDMFDENDQLDEQEVERIKNPIHYEKISEPEIENPSESIIEKPSKPSIIEPTRKSTRTIKSRNILNV